jgi:hypothetical protein
MNHDTQAIISQETENYSPQFQPDTDVSSAKSKNDMNYYSLAIISTSRKTTYKAAIEFLTYIIHNSSF